eukprot:gnl/Spiro4/9055_TR4773_c0_g1_i1.p1 gnl/Spiro4/9055_TR4773_c0_g1~~gnl/Spiro4/9055_TR4773_c0_g1_i1.p1  ORF type:complete len:116 (+),score=19.92 gnl/Spiro4/9055_TR4773_c0_g1_i1:80-427(+)
MATMRCFPLVRPGTALILSWTRAMWPLELRRLPLLLLRLRRRHRPPALRCPLLRCRAQTLRSLHHSQKKISPQINQLVNLAQAAVVDQTVRVFLYLLSSGGRPGSIGVCARVCCG